MFQFKDELFVQKRWRIQVKLKFLEQEPFLAAFKETYTILLVLFLQFLFVGLVWFLQIHHKTS